MEASLSTSDWGAVILLRDVFVRLTGRTCIEGGTVFEMWLGSLGT